MINISNFTDKLPTYELPKFELPKLELPKFELPKVDLTNFDLPKFDLPKVELPDLRKDAARITDLAREAAYIGLGAVVITVDQVTSQIRKAVGATS